MKNMFLSFEIMFEPKKVAITYVKWARTGKQQIWKDSIPTYS